MIRPMYIMTMRCACNHSAIGSEHRALNSALIDITHHGMRFPVKGIFVTSATKLPFLGGEEMCAGRLVQAMAALAGESGKLFADNIDVPDRLGRFFSNRTMTGVT